MDSDREKVGLRDRKAAATRLAIARALSQRLVSRSLGEITADEIAEAAGVSRMTFFNYFPSKELVLDHIFLTWLFEEQCESEQSGLRGLPALLHLFEHFGRITQESPTRARQIAAWFAARPLGVEPPELTRADRELIAPDHADRPLVMGRDRFPRAIAEAREAGEFDLPSSDFEIAHLIGTLLFATPLLGQSTPTLDWVGLYRHHARRALGLDVREGAARKKRPRTASTVRKKGSTR